MNDLTDSDPRQQTVELKIRPAQVVMVVLTILAVVGAALAALKLIDLLILVFVALVIAATIGPIKAALQRRHFPKGLAVLVIYLGILGALAALFVLVIPVLIQQGGALIRGLPQIYAGLISSLENSSIDYVRTLPQQLPTGEQLGGQMQAAGGSILTSILGIGAGVLTFLGQLISVLILSVYLTLDQSRLERFWLSLAPSNQRQELLSIWREIETRLGTYVRGELLLMTSIGVMAGVGYWVIGLPFSLALGVMAALLEFVPMVGPTLGSIPAIVVALTISPQTALVVVLYSVVIQVFENNFLVPRMMGKTVGVSPVMIIVAIFGFTSLLGIAGAFLAIPLAAVFQVLMDHVVVHGGMNSLEDGEESGGNIVDSMRAQIRRLRAEGQERLRTGDERIHLKSGDRDDVVSQAGTLLDQADRALDHAVQTAVTATPEQHTALLAEVGQVIHQAGVMSDTATAIEGTSPESSAPHLAAAEVAVAQAGENLEEARGAAERQNARLDKADEVISKAGDMVQEAKASSEALNGPEPAPAK